jgi:excisionase family DNA binding protein
VLAVHTLDEAAAILRVKQSWLERQAAARKIPFTMLGGAYHFTATHLVAIVQIHESAPVAITRGCDSSARPSRPRRASGPQTPTPLRPRPRSGPRRAA